MRQISRLNTGFVLAMFSWEIDGETVETVSDFIPEHIYMHFNDM